MYCYFQRLLDFHISYYGKRKSLSNLLKLSLFSELIV